VERRQPVNEMPTTEIVLEISSRLADVPLVGQCVHRLSEYHGFSAERCFEVELCVVEAVSNCIRHAYGDDRQGPVRVLVRLLCEEPAVELVIHDWGRPIPDHWSPGSGHFRFEEEGGFEEGGRGIFLISELMDEVHFSVAEDRSNRLRMRKRLGGEPSPATAS